MIGLEVMYNDDFCFCRWDYSSVLNFFRFFYFIFLLSLVLVRVLALVAPAASPLASPSAAATPIGQ